MIFGAAYYPEHWPEERWKRDAELMVEAGVNTARIGEFAWCRMEPEEGRYDFSWLERSVRLLEQYGISTMLCTPTASPTAWLAKKYPEILPVDEKGIVKRFGSRKNYCVNSPIYREYSRRIVTRLAEHFKDYKSIMGWQIDNEFGNRGSDMCYCPNCTEAFRKWLKNKYCTLENLNKCWGSIFWSHEYSDWEEIDPPMYSVTYQDPGIRLDYRRFQSDSFIEYQMEQVDILKKYMPQVPVTHNFMGRFYGIDYYKLAEDLDYVALDIYPNHGGAPSDVALRLDMTRGYKRGKSFVVAEQQCGQKIWAPVNTIIRPGILRLWTYDSICHGAAGIIYFSWRQFRFGSEKFHSALLTHDGLGDNRIYKEAKQVGNELLKIGNRIHGALPDSKVAMIFSFDNKWALDEPPSPSIHLDYLDTFARFYKALYNLNIQMDVVHSHDDLSKYKVVVAPLLYMVDQQTSNNLHTYVKNGGTLVGSMQTGLVDENDIVTEKPYPGELSDLFGIRVHEFDALDPSMSNTITFRNSGLSGHEYEVEIWCDIIESKGAEVLAEYREDFYEGYPAVTRNSFADGKAYYIGTLCKGSFLQDLFREIGLESGVAQTIDAEPGVEVRRVYKDDTEFVYLLNHNSSPARVTLDKEYGELLSDLNVTGTLELDAYDVKILSDL